MVIYAGVNCLIDRCNKPQFRSHWLLPDYSERCLYPHYIDLTRKTFSSLSTKFTPCIQLYGPEILTFDEATVRMIGSEFSQAGIKISVHENNGTFPLTEDPNFKTDLTRLFTICQHWDATDIVVHLPMKTGNMDNEIIENLIAVLSKAPKNCSIDIENKHHNCYYGNLDHFTTLLQKFDETVTERGIHQLKKNLNICFDFGHYIIQANEENYAIKEMLTEFFRLNDSRLRMFHLHLNDGTFDHHILPDESPYPQQPYVSIYNPDYVKVKEYGNFLADMLPIIHWDSPIDRWIITETEHPFTPTILASSINWLDNCIQKKK